MSVEAAMKLHKNRRVKVAATIASLVALVGAWGLVHRNPPPTASAGDSAAPAATPTASAKQPSSGVSRSQQPVQSAPRRHTRSRAS
jgi:hypothetical protein